MSVIIFGGTMDQAESYRRAKQIKDARVAFDYMILKGRREATEVHLVGTYLDNAQWPDFDRELQIMKMFFEVKIVVCEEV